MNEASDVISTVASLPLERPLPVAYVVGRITFTVLLACFIIMGNSVTIYAVIRTKKLRKLPTNVYVVSLAIADTSVGFFLLCLLAVPRLTRDEDVIRSSVCWARSPYYSTIAISTYTLLAIAVDRYIAVAHPLLYKSRMTIKRVIIVSLVIWSSLLVIIGATSCYYGTVAPFGRILAGNFADLVPTEVFICLILIVFLPVVANIFIYTAIFIRFRDRKKVSDSVDNTKPNKISAAVIKMMTIVLGYLLFAWIPYFSLTPVYKYGEIKPLWFIYINHAAIFLVYTNSAVNPIIYSWMNRDFREAYRRILKCRRAVAVDDSSTARTDPDIGV